VIVCFSTWTVLHGGGFVLRSELHDIRDFIIVVLKTLLAVSVADAACINNFGYDISTLKTVEVGDCSISQCYECL